MEYIEDSFGLNRFRSSHGVSHDVQNYYTPPTSNWKSHSLARNKARTRRLQKHVTVATVPL